jgi:hypothetical protein
MCKVLERKGMEDRVSRYRRLAQRVAKPDSERTAVFYTLMEEELEGRLAYGILCTAGEDWYERASFLSDVTSDRKAAERLLDLLARGGVTPYGLADAVTEWLLR